MKNNKLIRNLIYQSSYQLLKIIIPLVAAPILARSLGAFNNVIYAYNHNMLQYFRLFAMLGISTYGAHAIAKCKFDRENQSKSFWCIYFVEIAIALISITTYFVYIYVFQVDNIFLYLIFLIAPMTRVMKNRIRIYLKPESLSCLA